MSFSCFVLFLAGVPSTEPRKWVARAEMDLGEASRSSSSKPKVACADTESVLRTYVALLSESLGRECTQQLRHQGAPRPLDALLPEGMDKVLVSAAAASGDGAGAGNSLSLRRSGFFFFPSVTSAGGEPLLTALAVACPERHAISRTCVSTNSGVHEVFA